MPNKIKYTKEEFFKLANEIHGGKYIYNEESYVNFSKDISACCSIHGEFKIRASRHLEGNGCIKCKQVTCTADFIRKSKEVHGDKYTYRNSVYTHSKTKIIVTCPIHGDFLVKPTLHMRGTGCKECATESKRTPISEYITKCNKVHNEKYDYSKVVYNRSRDKITIICPIHGEFEQLPKDHMNGRGCVSCGVDKRVGVEQRRLVTDNVVNRFITNAKEIYGDKYCYQNANYRKIGKYYKVDIYCKEHDEVFTTKIDSHLKGAICPKCRTPHCGGFYNFNYFERNPSTKNVPGYFYLLRMFNEDEEFLKIGITKNFDTGRKYQYGNDIPYNYTILELIPMTMFDAYSVEHDIKKSIDNVYRYFPSTNFRGKSECYSIKIMDDLSIIIDSIK